MGLVVSGIVPGAAGPFSFVFGAGVWGIVPRPTGLVGNNFRRQSSWPGGTPVLVDRNRPQTQNGSRAWELFSGGASGISGWRT